MKKVSLIIPVYNSEKYIEKCVESIISQTYKNIQIIIINDGSKDNSLSIIKNLKDQYPDIIDYYDQENQGVAKTRNKAIEIASGDYVMFVDNDDYLDKDYVEKFVQAIEEADFDYVVGNFRRVDYDGSTLYTMNYKNLEWCFFMFSTPWARIFKREFLLNNKIQYLPIKMGEDLYFNILAITHTSKKKIIDYCGYNQLYNDASVSNTVHKKNTKKNIEELKYLFAEIFENVNKNYIKENEFYIRYFYIKTIIWYTLFSSRKGDPNEIYDNYIELEKWFLEHFEKGYKNVSFFKPKGENLKTRIIIKLVVFFRKMHLLKCFFKLYSKI